MAQACFIRVRFDDQKDQPTKEIHTNLTPNNKNDAFISCYNISDQITKKKTSNAHFRAHSS